MFHFKNIALAVLLVSSAASAQQEVPDGAPHAEVTALLTKALADYAGKEVTMLTVEYPPGNQDPVHRHDAHSFVYVLEGTIEMAVRGGETVTLTAGQTFYEGPQDVHTVGRNASATEPARFVVFLLKNSGAPILTPVE